MDLEQAKAELKAAIDNGDAVSCPCCGQLAKIYRRRLNSNMAIGLILLVREYTRVNAWVNISDLKGFGADMRVAGGEFAKLAHWSLIHDVTVPLPNQNGRTTGLWRPTAKGIDFVMRRVSVPSYVEIYNNRVVGRSDKEIFIDAALDKHFNYREMVGDMMPKRIDQPDLFGVQA